MKQVEEKEEASVYQRVVLKDASPYHYLKVHVGLGGGMQFDVSYVVIFALQVGAALNFDVLKYDEDTLTALLRVYSRGLVTLWSSLTLLGSYQNKACAFRVLQVSPFLLALTGNSRDLQLD
uniref:Ribonuclease P/MRP 14 subunit n=1 Tax=Amphilophus citrinellus TaxID=61819 RepID=A0A3Q0RQP0_AMPCI